MTAKANLKKYIESSWEGLVAANFVNFFIFIFFKINLLLIIKQIFDIIFLIQLLQ